MDLLFGRRAPVPRRKIFVADDERHIVQLVKSSLERAGFAVVTTIKASDILKKAHAE